MELPKYFLKLHQTAPTGLGKIGISVIYWGSPVRLGMQIANVKQRQILPRVGKIWVRTPQNRTYRPGGELKLPIYSKIRK